MATVMMSKARKESIMEHLKVMGEAAERDEVPDFKSVSEVDGSHAINTGQFWPRPDLVHEIPTDWMDEMNSAWCSITVTTKLPKMVKNTQSSYPSYIMDKGEELFEVKFPNTKEAYFRPKQGYGHAETVLTPEIILSLQSTDPGIKQLQANVRSWPEIVAVRAKWEKIRKSIATLLDQCGTINMALKHMPQLKFYLPQEILNQLNKEQEKREAKVVDLGKIDMEMITEAGVTHALTQKK